MFIVYPTNKYVKDKNLDQSNYVGSVYKKLKNWTPIKFTKLLPSMGVLNYWIKLWVPKISLLPFILNS